MGKEWKQRAHAAEAVIAALRKSKAELHALWVKEVEKNAELREALVALHAAQNGPPLIRDAAEWERAMEMTERALNKGQGGGE